MAGDDPAHVPGDELISANAVMQIAVHEPPDHRRVRPNVCRAFDVLSFVISARLIASV